MKRLITFLVALLVLVACGGQSSQEATAQALSESVSLTATAASIGSVNAGSALVTAEAEATSKAVSAQATQAAAANLDAAAISATETAVAPYVADLSLYGVDPNFGYMGWIHPPADLTVQGFLQYDYINQFIGTVAKDFVVSADITWNTTTGVSGCGFVLRSNGNQDALSQYMAIATRGANGRVVFSSMIEGDVQNAIDNYAYGIDPNFDWRNDTTNRLTIVARGNVFTIFTNGVQVGQVVAGEQPVLSLPPAPQQPPSGASASELSAYDQELAEYDQVVADIQSNYQQSVSVFQPNTPYFERGFVAMVALSESGTTSCQFDNSWLWIIDN